MKREILFVDDEPNVLQGLQRMLRPLRDVWNVKFAEGGAQALQMLAEAPFDVVVSDMRMPGMSGSQLLSAVRDRHPQIIRVILSGQSEKEFILEAVTAAHQFLSKPCEAEVLKATITRACLLRDGVSNPETQALVSSLKALPVSPSIHAELCDLLATEGTSLQKVGQTVAGCLGMSAKVLQLVNSAFFGLPRVVASPAEAVVLLGADTMKSLTLSCQIFQPYAGPPSEIAWREELWSSSRAGAERNEARAQSQGLDARASQASATVGLLRDCGKLVLAAQRPEAYAQVLDLAASMGWSAAEREVFGATHGEVGGYLLGLWGLPSVVVDAVIDHHAQDAPLARAA
ncbi:signal transduction protein [Capsulimonas corticalis]|uniref:Signal transduction protein n=1 Tax=Capsulimonas corticalis TaxID=2219043 RepID=A0A402D5E9_9BACT|nr:HDOD domain-containing protein [Capsulimonas corticalis]BDI29875.1 signal transduction protein [Capsulimonas corticalis]